MDTPRTLVDQKEYTSSPTPKIADRPLEEVDARIKDTEKQTPEPAVVPELSRTKTFAIVFIVCFAQFFDIYASASTIIALPPIGDALNFSQSELPWVISGYTLTFASFQLAGGRLSDIFHAKPVFIAGCAIVGIFSILCAVSVNAIMLIVFRAVQGIGAAFTVPSAVALIVQTVPESHAQSQALAAFGAAGAAGGSLGFVLAGVIASRASWVWIFYLTAIMILPLCVPAYFILPNVKNGESGRKLDLPGVGALTGGLILFVYAISDASSVGWGKPQIIVPLVFSVVFILLFFFVETKVSDPAVPPRVWSTSNLIPLFIYALTIYWFFYVSELQLVEVFQDLFGWSPLNAAIHCLPLGVAGGVSAYLCGRYGRRFPRRILLPSGQVLLAVGSILFALGDSQSKYWSHIFPGMIIGVLGTSVGYVGVTVAIMASARKGEEGVVGALVNTAFQLGATVGLAISTAVVLGVNNKLPSDAPTMDQFTGYQDGFWSLVALHGLITVISVVFVR